MLLCSRQNSPIDPTKQYHESKMSAEYEVPEYEEVYDGSESTEDVK